jgi:hypothetical protein
MFKKTGATEIGRIPAQLVAHILYFFSEPGDLVLDPMAGGGVCADTCLAMGRRCWTLTHLIQAPMSSERFNGGVVYAMQKKKILGVTSRYVMVLK